MNYFSNRGNKPRSDVVVNNAVTIGLALLTISMASSMQTTHGSKYALESAKAFAQLQPNINATNLYDSGHCTLRY